MVIQALGFGATGIAKGSSAALLHSMCGNVTAGSVFASVQSAGAVGALSWTTIGGLTLAGGTVGMAAVVTYYWWKSRVSLEVYSYLVITVS